MLLRVQHNMHRFYFSSAGIAQMAEGATPKMLGFFDGLLTDELARRQAARKSRMVRQAGFPSVKSLDDYDFSVVTFPDDMGREAVTSLSFIAMRHSLVFYGVCGSGKTMLAVCLGLKACQAGYAVRFMTLAQLSERLRQAQADERIQGYLEGLRKLDLLILDEWGYCQLSRESAQQVFQVISDSYEHKSLIVTTNLPFSQWGKVVTDEQIAAAIIDRIVHYGHLVDTGDRDWRLAHSPMNGQVIGERPKG
jgi:DNA replication protein DnaC